MDPKRYFLLLGTVLLVHPTWAQLPSPVEMPTHPPPTPPPPPKPTVPPSTINFDFQGFFKYFIEAFGRNALKELLRMTDWKYKSEFPNAATVPTVAGPPAIPCSTAPYITGSTVVYSDPLTRAHGSTATYKCATGYQGTDVVIQCQSGVWTKPAANVSCTIVMCGNPPPVDNAVVQVSDYTFGSQASYTCKPGFHASDIAHPIRCKENGQWDPPQFTCANMMANNHAMSAAMSNFGMTMPGLAGMMPGGGFGGSGQQGMPGMQGMQGLPPSMQGMMAEVAASLMRNQMQSMAGGQGTGGMPGAGMMGGMQLPPHLMGGQMMGGITGGEQAALPAHLQQMASMAPLLDPTLMSSMGMGLPGMTGGTAGAAAAPNRKPMEPEQMQEMNMMMAMMSMARAQQQRQAMQRRMQMQQMQQQQLLKQRQQQQQQQQQQQSSDGTPGINIGALLTPQQQQQQQQQQSQQSSTDPASQIQMLQTAVQQMQALATQLQAAGIGTQAGGGSTSGTETASPASGQTGGTAGSGSSGGSVFGGSGASGSTAPSPSSGSNTEASNPLMSAIMQSALQG